MSKVVWLAILGGAFYAHGQILFSERYVSSWMGKQERAALEGKDNVCDGFSKDIQVSLKARSAQGVSSFEGGFDEYCNYSKEVGQMLKALRANVSINTEVERVEISGFPWMTATATVTKTSHLSVARMPSMSETTNGTIVFKRTFSGLQISQIDAQGQGQLNN